MKALETFIDQNYSAFSNMGYSEVEEIAPDTFDNEMLMFLKQNYRFDYKGICVYYEKEENMVFVELM